MTKRKCLQAQDVMTTVVTAIPADATVDGRHASLPIYNALQRRFGT
jgi:hypothetical protein